MACKVAYCSGFWCTNIGNAFFGLGVEYALKKILGEEKVTIVSDYQTYTTGYGRRLYPSKNQLEYISQLDIDYLVLAGPVLSKYFLKLWKDILIKLQKRGVGYIILSAGMMKMTDESKLECRNFFKKYPPFVLLTRDYQTYDEFGKYAVNAFPGICFSFFVSEYYHPCKMKDKFIVMNFDKSREPSIRVSSHDIGNSFLFNSKYYQIKQTGMLSNTTSKTDRFSDAIVYATSVLPQKKMKDKIGGYKVFRTDHRFHPHFRNKIYSQHNSFCADLPYGYLNLYANTELTLSDRVHACAVTMAFGKSAMLFSETNRVGLLERVGAGEITMHPVSLDLNYLSEEKNKMLNWLKSVIG